MLKRRLWCFLLFLLVISCVVYGRGEKLVVYTYSSFPAPLMDEIRKVLREQHNLTVDFKSFSDTGPLFNQLIQEKGKPYADVVIGLDNNYYPRAVQEDLFQAYIPRGAQLIRKDLIFDPEFRLTPFDFGYVLFNYDSAKLEQVPRTHQELTDPAYKGKIIITNPMTSSPGQVFLLTTIALFGEDGYLDYWRKLKDNILAITPGWDEAYGMYTMGEAPIVLSYGASPVFHLLYENTEQYKALVLDNSAYAQIEGVGIVKGARNLAGAKKLLDYLLSAEFQALIPENQFMMPVRTDVKLPESFRVAAQVDHLLNLPPERVEANLERWLAAWEEMINE